MEFNITIYQQDTRGYIWAVSDKLGKTLIYNCMSPTHESALRAVKQFCDTYVPVSPPQKLYYEYTTGEYNQPVRVSGHTQYLTVNT